MAAKKPPVRLKRYLAVREKAKTTIDGDKMSAAQIRAIQDARKTLNDMRTKLSKAGFGKAETKTRTNSTTKKPEKYVLGYGMSKALKAWEKEQGNT
jgi:hypothetical protein